MSRTVTPPYFHAGQKVVCVDASPNQRGGAKLLTSGKTTPSAPSFRNPDGRRLAGACTWKVSGSFTLTTAWNGRSSRAASGRSQSGRPTLESSGSC
jgi:hypothetical protein